MDARGPRHLLQGSNRRREVLHCCCMEMRVQVDQALSQSRLSQPKPYPVRHDPEARFYCVRVPRAITAGVTMRSPGGLISFNE